MGGDEILAWKQALLQFLITLLPVFTFQIWFERSTGRQRNIPFMLSVTACITLLISIWTAIDIDGIRLDYQLAIVIVGSLYGGTMVMGSLASIYLLFRLIGVNGWWDWLELISFSVIFLPLLYLSLLPFFLGSRKRKQRIAFLLMTGANLIAMGSYVSHNWYAWESASTPQSYLWLLLHGISYYVVVWLLVFLTENYIERQTLGHELKVVSANYRNEVQKLQQFIEETPLSVIIVDHHGNITHINEMAIHSMTPNLSSKDRAGLLGQSYTVLCEGGSVQDAQGKLLSQALRGHPTSTEFVQDKDKMYLKTGISLRDEQSDTVIGAAIICHDITELNRLRDEIGRMERLSLVGQMAASITHEIRNPMAVIRGFVQLMKERSPDHQQEYFRIVMDELDRANAIINDFLSLAQNRVIDKHSGSLHDIVNEMLPLLWADANMRGQSIELELAPEIKSFMMNGKEMKQLILNLARNGMEAMDGTGVLRLCTFDYEDRIELHVIDNGCGIPKEKQERLFEPFYTTKTRGTGLGLPLCLSIVERHGGEIHVESTEGVGTNFIVSFQYKTEN